MSVGEKTLGLLDKVLKFMTQMVGDLQCYLKVFQGKAIRFLNSLPMETNPN